MKKKEKKKKTVKTTELPIEVLTFGFSQVELNQYTEQEFIMIAADRQEKERADARNALEEYVYELRGKLSSDEDLALFLLENDRSELITQLDNMENWLYEEGEDCTRQVYQDKLQVLKAKGEPIQMRKIEYELRPTIVESFQQSLQLGMKAMEQLRNNNEKYAHLSQDDRRKVEQAVNTSYQWLEQARQNLANVPKHHTPPITVAQIRQEKANYENTVNPILTKAPPKAPSPPREEAKNQQQKQNSEQQKSEEEINHDNAQEKMDCS